MIETRPSLFHSANFVVNVQYPENCQANWFVGVVPMIRNPNRLCVKKCGPRDQNSDQPVCLEYLLELEECR